MSIRKATLGDQKAISELLSQLEYPGTETFIAAKIQAILQQPQSELLVYEAKQQVLAFACLVFITQLASKGDYARISYLVVDSANRSQGIGKIMETHCVRLASQRNGELIELHCHQRRKDAYRFYLRQGYQESPIYFIKRIHPTEQ